MTAPVLSRTIPARMPLLVCAMAGRMDATTRDNTKAVKTKRFKFILFSLILETEGHTDYLHGGSRRRGCCRASTLILPPQEPELCTGFLACVAAETSLASVGMNCASGYP